MNKELLKYKESLIKNGFVVFDENGKIKDLVTKSEIIESIKREQETLDKIESLITDETKQITGKINLVKKLSSFTEPKQILPTMDVVQLEINEIQEYININDFASELQNRDLTLGLVSKEVEKENKRDQLVDKVNNQKPLTGYQILIVKKSRIIEESSNRNR